jgi:tetraacyldisaccharide 4'-kinase
VQFSEKMLSRIEAIMNSKGVPGPGWLRKGLYAISLAYGCAVRLRTAAYDAGLLKAKRLPCVVISIGNVIVGGTGKTPLTIYLSEILVNQGYRVVVISRGYGGSAVNSGGIVSDGCQVFMSVDTCGDEPYMMAHRLENIPILVGKDRYRSGLTAVDRFKPDVILLDDAFQHRRLARDLDLVLLDARNPFGNRYLFPRGCLREPMVSVKRGHALVFSRSQNREAHLRNHLDPLIQAMPVFDSHHNPTVVKIIAARTASGIDSNHEKRDKDLAFLNGKRVLAFSGIARNEEFFKVLRTAGCHLVDRVPFRDHHRYSRDDIRQIQQTAVDRQAVCILTTEKDYYRLSRVVEWPLDLVVVGVDLVFNDAKFDRFIAEKVASLVQKKDRKDIA